MIAPENQPILLFLGVAGAPAPDHLGRSARPGLPGVQRVQEHGLGGTAEHEQPRHVHGAGPGQLGH